MRKLLLATVILILLGAGAGRLSGPFLARTHFTVRVARRIAEEDTQGLTERTLESEAFRNTGTPVLQLYADAERVIGRFRIGGALFGAWLGLVIGLRLLGQTVINREDEYHIDREACVSCGRCFRFCARERLRRKRLAGLATSSQVGSDA